MRFWFARLAGVSANQMLMAAVAWHMYDITSSAWALGLVGLFQFVPALLLANCVSKGSVFTIVHGEARLNGCYRCIVGLRSATNPTSNFERMLQRILSGSNRLTHAGQSYSARGMIRPKTKFKNSKFNAQ
jgi:hypothetical protein